MTSVIIVEAAFKGPTWGQIRNCITKTKDPLDHMDQIRLFDIDVLHSVRFWQISLTLLRFT